MPAKSGASHAMAAFLSIILGSIISNFLSAHTDLLTNLSERIGGGFAGAIGVSSLPENAMGLIIISTVLAFLWGVAYHHARHRTSDRKNGRKNYVTDNQSTNETQQMSQYAVTHDETDHPVQNGDDTQPQLGSGDESETEYLKKVERDLDHVKSGLDQLYDRLYDAGKREAAERVSNLVTDVTTIERTVTRAETLAASQLLESKNATKSAEESPETVRDLARTHDRLVNTAEELISTVEDATNSTDVNNSFFEECELLLRDLERTLSKRQDILDQRGD